MRVGLHDRSTTSGEAWSTTAAKSSAGSETWACSPTDDAAHPAAGGIVIVEGDQSASPLSAPWTSTGAETPQRHVLQGLLPAGEQGGRNAARRRRRSRIGQPARPSGIGVVTGQTGLVGESATSRFVDSGHDPPDVTRQTAPIRHLTQIDRVAGEGTDRPMLGRSRRDRRSPSGRGPRSPRAAPGGRDGDRRLQFGTGGCGARCPDHPPSVFGVPDEGDVEPVVGQAGQASTVTGSRPGTAELATAAR